MLEYATAVAVGVPAPLVAVPVRMFPHGHAGLQELFVPEVNVHVQVVAATPSSATIRHNAVSSKPRLFCIALNRM